MIRVLSEFVAVTLFVTSIMVWCAILHVGF